ncbi:hypothetical protein [Wolbachia endosymbiont (group B) of Rhopobota naevana]|uniref:hypothetical protein n=1 Tax=Wolbachia endosymbiont (group B) of Rhopobota naevana TaxID=2954054 RepID=UPI00222805CA|nr:hypothetical protein [Wolbachia endosymbiont (group B) of Rhopobota naevana]
MSYIQEYKENLEKCLDDNTEKIGKCDNECHKNFFKHHWSVPYSSEECSKALKNLGCVKVGIRHDCHRWCEDNYQGLLSRPGCKLECDEYVSSKKEIIGYPKDYYQTLKKCLDDNTEKIGKCDNECHKNFFKHHWSVPYSSEECSKALKNSGCVKVGVSHDCHRWCEDNYQGLISRPACKECCNMQDKFKFSGDTKNTSEDVGDNFYILEDLVSVL